MLCSQPLARERGIHQVYESMTSSSRTLRVKHPSVQSDLGSVLHMGHCRSHISWVTEHYMCSEVSGHAHSAYKSADRDDYEDWTRTYALDNISVGGYGHVN